MGRFVSASVLLIIHKLIPLIQVFAVINHRASQSTFTGLLMQEVHLPQAIGLRALVIQRGTFYVVSVKTLKLLLSSQFMDGERAKVMSSLWKLLVLGETRTGKCAVIISFRKTCSHSCLPLHLRWKIAIPLMTAYSASWNVNSLYNQCFSSPGWG